MKIFFCISFIFIFNSLFSTDKYAVVIGNSQYKNIKELPLVENDVNDVSTKLRSLGFQVSVLENSSSSDVEHFFKNYHLGISDDSMVVFYYVGHGANINGHNLLLDPNVSNDTLDEFSISLNYIVSKLYSTNAETILIFSDIYKNNPFYKGVNRSLKVITKSTKTKKNKSKKLGFIYSTSSGINNYDSIKELENSPFTTAFLKNISIPNIGIHSILSRISKDVGLITSGKQVVEKSLEFDKDIVINESISNSVITTENSNTLSTYNYGILNIHAKDDCLISFSNGLKADVAGGRDFEIELISNEYLVTFEGEYRTQELKVNIKPGSTSYMVFEDYDFNDGETSEESKEEYNIQDYLKQFVEVSMEKNGEVKSDSILLVSRFETSQKVFEYIMGYNPSSRVGDNLPVDKVSLAEAVVFCNRLSRLMGFGEVYSIDKKGRLQIASKADGYRLPSNEEFNFLVKGGGDSRNYIFSGSDNPFDVAWIADEELKNSDPKIEIVGLKEPNELGLHDLHGNVSEWCVDWDDSHLVDKYNFILAGGNRETSPEDLSKPIRLKKIKKVKFAGFRVLRSVN